MDASEKDAKENVCGLRLREGKRIVPLHLSSTVGEAHGHTDVSSSPNNNNTNKNDGEHLLSTSYMPSVVPGPYVGPTIMNGMNEFHFS